jgi:hypothetical protein
MADQSRSGSDLFEVSEGTRADRKNLLGLALLKVNANIYLAQLMIWIFNTSHDSRPLRKSYEELASRPWGLCCSRNQAYATAQKAKRLGMLVITTTWSGPGIQGANEYAIDWVGVRRIVGLRQPVTYPTTCDPPPTSCDPPPTTCDPPPTSLEAPPTTCDHIEEYTSIHLSSPTNTSSPSCIREEEAGVDASAWGAVRQKLLDLGVYFSVVDEALDSLSSRGGSPLDAAMLAEQFTTRRKEFGAGALALALKHWRPGQAYDAAGLWPTATRKEPASGKWRV